MGAGAPAWIGFYQKGSKVRVYFDPEKPGDARASYELLRWPVLSALFATLFLIFRRLSTS